MFKRSTTIFVAVLLAFLWSSSVLAQVSSPFKDNYEGQYIKQEVPLGQNVPLQYEGPLVVLHDNGPLITHAGGGFGGADASALQTALGMGTYGYGHQISAGNSIADDFTISGAAWNIDELRFYAYQTGSSTTSTINDLRMQIYDGDPSTGGTVIFGDLTTNVLATTTWSNIYRVLDTDLLASNRPIMENVVQLSPALNLGAGTYWIEWQCGGTLTSGPWAPPVTVLGSTGTGNALQNTGTWAPAIDVGPQDFPFLVLGNAGPPCPVDPPTNPTPPDGATGVPISGNTAMWTNGAGTTANEIYFGEVGSLVLVYDGPAITSLSLAGVEPLNYVTDYGWQVICKNDTCGVSGPVWTFTTEQDPSLNCVFFDDFEGSLTAWTITNLGGSCDWTQYFPPYPNSYNMPPTSSGGVLSADADECGSGTTINSAAQIGPFDASLYQTGYVQFDNDFNAIGADDSCFVEVSTDGGTTWNIVWSQIGIDLTATTEFVDISTYSNQQATVWVRFRSVQPGWDWWWTIDNVEVCLSDIIPVELGSFTASAINGSVNLSWITVTETNNQGFEIERSDGSSFEKIGYVQGNGTTTEPIAYTFTDDNVIAGSYSYRLRQIDFDGSYEFSQTIEVDVPTPTSFALGQNYPNPFNPTTKVDFSLALDAKVTLKVFDLLGQEVMTVVNTNLVAGNHTVDIDATQLNSGVYFYKIEADAVNGTNFVDVKKMILTK